MQQNRTTRKRRQKRQQLKFNFENAENLPRLIYTMKKPKKVISVIQMQTMKTIPARHASWFTLRWTTRRFTNSGLPPSTAELFKIICISGLMAHSHADDTQIYLNIASTRAQEAVDGLSECVFCVDDWMCNNRLTLNTDKTRVIWLGTRQQLMKVNTSDIYLQSGSVPCLSAINNLGVLIDRNL